MITIDADYLTNWQENEAGFTVPDPIKLVIAKAMFRHKLLLFKETHQDSGWRKVYRIAQANGAFYDSINSMRVSIGQWKMKALAKLSKDPKAITELDKLIYQIYDVDTGELDCEIAAADSDATTIKLEHKRVKIEVQPDEIPRIGIGKKEGGLCPHCGEVSLIISGVFIMLEISAGFFLFLVLQTRPATHYVQA